MDSKALESHYSIPSFSIDSCVCTRASECLVCRPGQMLILAPWSAMSQSYAESVKSLDDTKTARGLCNCVCFYSTANVRHKAEITG